MTEFLDACYDAIRIQKHSIADTFESVKQTDLDIISDKKSIFLLGCGDSYAAAVYGRWALLQVGLNAIAISPPEISRIPIGDEDLVIGVTASGRSLATVAALNSASSFSLPET